MAGESVGGGAPAANSGNSGSGGIMTPAARARASEFSPGNQPQVAERASPADFGRFSANSGEFRGQASQPLTQLGSEETLPPSGFDEYEEMAVGTGHELAPADDSLEGDVLETDAAQKEQAERYKRWEEWEASDDLPEALHNKFGKVTINGDQYRITADEAFRGYQRQEDYTQKLAEVYAYRDQVAAKERGIDVMLSALDAGESFLDMMVYLGKFKGFHDAAIIYGTQLDEERTMTPRERERVARERQARAIAHKLEVQNRQLQAQLAQVQPPQQVSKSEQYYRNQLAQLVPQAIARMAKRGVEWVDSNTTRLMFENDWRVLIRSLEGKDLTTDIVADALTSVMQQIGSLEKAGHIQPVQPVRAQQQLPPVPQVTGPTQAPPNGRRQQRARIGDLSTLVHRR